MQTLPFEELLCASRISFPLETTNPRQLVVGQMVVHPRSFISDITKAVRRVLTLLAMQSVVL